MKKLSLLALGLTGLLSASVSFAGSALNDYYSSLRPKLTLTKVAHPPTDVTVINASSNGLYVIVPGSPVNDYLSPGENDHIYHYDPNVWSVNLVLQDPSHKVFYNTNVCRLAIVTVYGYPGHYRINTDSDLCQ